MRENRNTPGRKIAEAIIAEYKLTGYLGYESNDKGEKMTENHSPKTIKTSMGESEISILRSCIHSF